MTAMSWSLPMSSRACCRDEMGWRRPKMGELHILSTLAVIPGSRRMVSIT
jgi:hypothetical protein